jgi:LacI family transcriptional regulator/LacI family repressor for deo operon, udp, cdd, tsx, nupC, and nupG
MVSIYDIARTANVSPSTVSRALQGNTRVGTATTARILAIAHELGYVPSSAARNLSTQRSQTIALILSTISDPSVGSVVEGIERQAAKVGYDILLAISRNDVGREQEIIATARQRRVDGIVLIASQMAARYNQLFDDLHIPTVVISEQELHDNVLVVRADDYASAQLATNHLLDLGHIRIGYLGVHDRPASQKPRVAGYYDALTARGITPDPELVLIGNRADHLANGYAAAPAFVQRGATAVFCYNDSSAIGLLSGCRHHGITVPEQLSVVGFDDIDMAQYSTPPLTTLRQPRMAIGEAALKTLLLRMQEQSTESLTFPGELIIRKSTAPGPHKPEPKEIKRLG